MSYIHLILIIFFMIKWILVFFYSNKTVIAYDSVLEICEITFGYFKILIGTSFILYKAIHFLANFGPKYLFVQNAGKY